MNASWECQLGKARVRFGEVSKVRVLHCAVGGAFVSAECPWPADEITSLLTQTRWLCAKERSSNPKEVSHPKKTEGGASLKTRPKEVLRKKHSPVLTGKQQIIMKEVLHWKNTEGGASQKTQLVSKNTANFFHNENCFHKTWI